MLWITSAASVPANHFNWDAVSAVGTAGAAIIALTVWLADLHSKSRQRRAANRLAAILLEPDVTGIDIQIDRCYDDFWVIEQESETPNVGDPTWCFTYLTTRRGQLSTLLTTHIERLRSNRLDRHLERIDMLPTALSDDLARLVAAIGECQHLLRELLELADALPGHAIIVSTLGDYYDALHVARRSATSTRKQLSRLAPINGEVSNHKTPADGH